MFEIALRDWEWVNENPLRKISKPKATPGRQRFLSEDERSHLLNEVKMSKCKVLYAVVILALSTGMRRGEIMGLRWKDVNFENSTIILQTSKNGEPRSIPLVGFAHQILKKLSEEFNIDPNLLVFCSPSNSYKAYDIQTAWKAAIKRANLKNFTFHDLRHSTASYHAANGKSLFEIGVLLGHKSQQTTKRYAHLTHKHTSQMIEEIDQKIFGEISAL